MELLQKISFSILLQESSEARKIIHQIFNSKAKSQSDLSICMIPFLSSICEGIITSFQLQNVELSLPDIEDISFEKLVKSTRASYKLYSDKKTNKLQNQGEVWKNYLESNYNYFQKKFIQLFGQEDLGVFTFIDIPYGNTSQYNIYLEKLLDLKTVVTIGARNEKRTKLLEYSGMLASLINQIVMDLSEYNGDREESVLLQQDEFKYKDYYFYDKKRKNVLGGSLPINTQLFLFNILCQNNFINIIMPDIFDVSGSFYYRTKLQAYLISVNSLSQTLRNHASLINEKQVEIVEQLVEEKGKYFTFENKLRNNIFHYEIKGVPASIFKDKNRYFEEMVEYSVGINYKKIIDEIDNSLITINELIRDLINYDM